MSRTVTLVRWVVSGCVLALSLGAAWAGPSTAAVPGTARLQDRRLQQQVVRRAVGASDIATIPASKAFFPQSVASGDPRTDSVILWTRVDDPGLAAADYPVRVIVTKDKYFHQVVKNEVVSAKAAYDHCVKLKVSGLQPGTTYLYFFVYEKAGTLYLSPLGRTKTAPAPGSNVPVRFAYFNCQDYVGRYYNTYLKLLLDHRDDLDFIVHLGDYVYETTGDPSFQDPSSTRKIVFSDLAGAIKLGDPQHPYYAASSLSNYRELYKTYRTDPILQQVHELYPMIVIWDDHEYTDDNWGDTGTYYDGRTSEKNPVRRRNGERAFFEFIPIDWGLDSSGQLAISDAVLYPNARIYRDFKFGANVHLMLTDYRSYRPDHIVPEDAFPGKVVLDKATLQAVLGAPVYDAIKASFDPYYPIDANPILDAGLTAILTQFYALSNPFLDLAGAAAKAEQASTGNVSATYINALFDGAGYPPPFDEATLGLLDRGLSYLYVGKQDLYSQSGARYVLVQPTFELLSAVTYQLTGGASENAFGNAQQGWLRTALATSTATWKVLGNSTSMTPMIIDFTNPVIASFLPPTFPDWLRVPLQLNADQWDGFPHARAGMVGLLAQIPNSVIISGDIHGSFVTSHGHGVYELTGAAASSKTFQDEVLNQACQIPGLCESGGIEQLVAMLDLLLQISVADPQKWPAQIAYDNTGGNGFVVIEASANELLATYYHIPAEYVGTSYYANPTALNALFDVKRFRVAGGVLTPLP